MSFEPIAIVGRACVLPGALDPTALWRAVAEGRDLLGAAPPGRWRADPARLLGTPADATDRTWTDRGGYVDGFESRFDPAGFAVPAESLAGLDPVFLWLLHVSREALRDAGLEGGDRVGGVFGNLSFPSASMARFAEEVWLGDRLARDAGIGPVDPRNRFMSGLPAHLVAQALGLGGGAFALDAACASSLYAIKLACDRLHDRSADVMLAGAVNAADDLFIHVGFCALQAMSRTGRSRPFHREADGLVPAEGAGVVVLRRLADAEAAGERILGVIRGIGLSNDGRGSGLLVPSEEGQVRAMRAAYDRAGLRPSDVSLVECHATGTSVGDGVELRSMARVFEDAADLPIGSLKSNLGHAITVAGVAGLLKVLGAMEAQVRPPTLHAHEPLDALGRTPFRLLHEAEPWPSDGPRRAAVSAFGFGGNNAHLIVEEYAPAEAARPVGARPKEQVTDAPDLPEVAVVAVGAAVGSGRTTAEFEAALFEGAAVEPRAGALALPATGTRFPPRDLDRALAQQLWLLSAAREAVETAGLGAGARGGVFVGMGCDPEVARYGARWRAGDWAERWGADEGGFPAQLRDAFTAPLDAAGVLGTMPNVAANRLNVQLDLGGQGFTVSAEELSGIRALEVAARAVATGELDFALVGAADFSSEPVHQEALARLGRDPKPGDGAVVLVLERVRDARLAGHPVLAVLGGPAQAPELPAEALESRFGRAHAAFGLVRVAAAALGLARGRRIGGEPWTEPRAAKLVVDALGGQQATVFLRAASPEPVAASAPAAPSGPQREYPAHPPQVSIPELPRDDLQADLARQRPLAPPNGAQPMPPAPRLPPVLEEEGDAPKPSAASVRSPEPRPSSSSGPRLPPPGAPAMPPNGHPARPSGTAPALRQAPVVEVQQARAPAAPPAPAVPAGIFEQLAAGHAQVARVHRQFVEAQAAAQQSFLALREQAARALLQASGAPSPALPPIAFPAAPPPHTPPRPAAPSPSPPDRQPPTAAPQLPPEARQQPTAGRPPQPAAPSSQPTFPGPKLDRRGLEVHASGRISEIYGPLFEQQDAYARQVRMPEPPLLLADRLLGIDAEPGSMGLGTLWTETDVTRDSWYLHEGHMPAGIMIEAGQADLMLISYLGIDFLNRGDRVYRLLGCELTWHGGLPAPGDTLRYDIHVDGHARQGDIRLFFFHYDCQVGDARRLSVRNGQAGFFTDQELDESMGVLWDAETAEHSTDGRLDPPAVECRHTRFDRAQLEAFAAGRVRECFGPGFEAASTHTRTPRIAGGRMLLLEEVTDFSPTGGPWGRGYLRAVDRLSPDDWFFEGHFKNDPCMPGTLMLEGCLQAMATYLTGFGYTLDKDGWRFEPVPEEKYTLLCRGQATPRSREVVYEVFVEEVVAGPEPILWADILCTVDGLKAFHTRRMGLRLTPGWPLDSRPELVESLADPKPVAAADGFEFGARSLLACAWGRPSEAFGPMYAPFDGPRRVPRLPGPPYQFMSRVTRVEGAIGAMEVGSRVEVEYDVPPDAWYFEDNGAPVMPFCVLLEAALQPCGWLASYVGSATTVDGEVSFRNLDGTGTLLEEIRPDSGVLRTEVTLTGLSRSAGMIIESFDVTCFAGDRRIYELKTVFGFFPKEALEAQKGTAVPEDEPAWLTAPSAEQVDLRPRPARYFGAGPRLPSPELCMLHRVTGIWPDGGAAGLGRFRAEHDVDPDAWFFKAHFFQDPVQPGSLGLEAMLQLLQFAMIRLGLAGDAGRFEAIARDAAQVWKYRGQVLPKNARVTTLLEVTRVDEDARGPLAVADASLWVDGLRIYEAKGLGMRVVRDGSERAGESEDDALAPHGRGAAPSTPPPADPALSRPAQTPDEEVLDPALHAWIGDHRPTWTVPALPLMSMVDRLASAAARALPGRRVIAVEDARALRWVPVTGPVRLRTEVVQREDGRCDVRLLAWRDALQAALSRFEPVASGRVILAEGFPEPHEAPWEPIVDARPAPDPYASGVLFHGPSFRLLRSLAVGRQGSTATLDLDAAESRGLLNEVFLDALTHGMAHDDLSVWSPEIAPDQVAFPHRASLRLFGEPPRSGTLRLESRFVGFDGDLRFPRLQVQAIDAGRLVAALDLTEVLFPKGPLGSAAPDRRRAFLRDRVYVEGVRLSTDEGRITRLTDDAVRASNWLPGTLETVYGGDARAEALAVKEHVAARARVHPSTVRLAADGASARCDAEPLTVRPVAIARNGAEVAVQDRAAPRLDLEPVRAFWDRWFGIGRWPVEDLYYGLAERFLRRVRISDPEAFAAVRGRPLVFLGNHQVGIESLLFSLVASELTGVPTMTLAKAEHRTSWLGRLIVHAFAWPGARDPKVITYFERDEPEQLPKVIADLAETLAGGKSVMVHVEGTRALSCRAPVVKMSGAFLDMALAVNAPVVPVRFVGGLPVEPLEQRIEFPVGMGRQDLHVGQPLLPEELRALTYKARKERVIGAMNALGPSNADERPLPGDAELAADADAWARATGASHEHATLLEILRRLPDPHPEIRRLLQAAEGGTLEVAGDPHGRWLAELARRLFGKHGPRIVPA